MRRSDPKFGLHHCTRLPIEENGADRPPERSLHPHSSQRAEGRTERGLSITDLAEVYGGDGDRREIHSSCPHPAADAPGLSIATLAEVARDFAPTKRTSTRRKRRHHGMTVGVGAANPSEPLGVQLPLGCVGSHWGRHAS